MGVSAALKHIRSVGREKESIYACYVMEPVTSEVRRQAEPEEEKYPAIHVGRY